MVGTHVDTVQSNGATNNTDAAFAVRFRNASSTLGFPNVVRPALKKPSCSLQRALLTPNVDPGHAIAAVRTLKSSLRATTGGKVP